MKVVQVMQESELNARQYLDDALYNARNCVLCKKMSCIKDSTDIVVSLVSVVAPRAIKSVVLLKNTEKQSKLTKNVFLKLLKFEVILD